MHYSKFDDLNVGYSTGALSKGDFRTAIDWLMREHIHVVELSALRFEELEPLVDCLESLDLSHFKYISVHAPSSFRADQEATVVQLLWRVSALGVNMVVHPDVIGDYALWETFGGLLLLENMDKRKETGRSAAELRSHFDRLPQARLCFDIAHAYQCDSTMSEAWAILDVFYSRLAEIHISEVDSSSKHRSLSNLAAVVFQEVTRHIPASIPAICEAPVQFSDALDELGQSAYALNRKIDRPLSMVPSGGGMAGKTAH